MYVFLNVNNRRSLYYTLTHRRRYFYFYSYDVVKKVFLWSINKVSNLNVENSYTA
jgi:hypothetical protein